jgi:hypothetical protein
MEVVEPNRDPRCRGILDAPAPGAPCCGEFTVWLPPTDRQLALRGFADVVEFALELELFEPCYLLMVLAGARRHVQAVLVDPPAPVVLGCASLRIPGVRGRARAAAVIARAEVPWAPPREDDLCAFQQLRGHLAGTGVDLLDWIQVAGDGERFRSLAISVDTDATA